MPSTTAAKSTRTGGRKSASLPAETVEYLKSWMMHPDHISHPYPTDQEKASIMADTGIELKQLTNWFVNNRKRYWKPRVEAAAAGTPQHVDGGGAPFGNQTKIQVNSSCPPSVAASSGSTSSASLSLDSTSLDELHWQQEEAAAVAAVAALHQAQPEVIDASAAADHDDQEEQLQDDPHTISEGSGSSCADTDDDDSHDDSYQSRRRDSSSNLSQMYDSSSQSTTSSTSIMTAEGYRRHEEVDIYILRPEHPTTSSNKESSIDPLLLPTIRDLTIKSSAPKERILAVYKCPITYTIPFDMENDKRRVQSRRDGEVLRAKKYYLKLYLTSRGIPTAASRKEDETDVEDIVDIEAPIVSPTNLNDGPASSSLYCLDLMTYHHAVYPALSRAVSSASISTTTTTPRRRMREFSIDDLERAFEYVDENMNRSRKCARTVTTHDWREMCCNASGAYDTNLPSLEEAARMFGFAHTS